MRTVLESLRFTFIFFMLLTILGGITELTYSIIGVNLEKYGWTAVVGTFVLVFALYKNKEWDKVYNKKVLWTSIILIVLLSMLIPAVSPTHLHTNKYAYLYGFPFKFLTIYIESETKFLIPNLTSGKLTGWNLDTNIFGNFIIIYFSLHFIFKKVIRKQRAL